MNTLKKVLIASAMTMPVLAAAADYPWLTFSMTDGSELSVAADNLDIRYNDGALLLSSTTVNQAIPTDGLRSMRFTSTAAGICDAAVSLSAESIYYTLAGFEAGTFASADDARAVLPSGTYIVKTADKTFKVIF